MTWCLCFNFICTVYTDAAYAVHAVAVLSVWVWVLHATSAELSHCTVWACCSFHHHCDFYCVYHRYVIVQDSMSWYGSLDRVLARKLIRLWVCNTACSLSSQHYEHNTTHVVDRWFQCQIWSTVLTQSRWLFELIYVSQLYYHVICYELQL